MSKQHWMIRIKEYLQDPESEGLLQLLVLGVVLIGLMIMFGDSQ